jgi:hypothetical protein
MIKTQSVRDKSAIHTCTPKYVSTCGGLYVAFSRVRYFDHMKVFMQKVAKNPVSK